MSSMDLSGDGRKCAFLGLFKVQVLSHLSQTPHTPSQGPWGVASEHM